MTDKYPKITIVTPSYNQAEFLERTILSVINQGYPNLEYFIIDGGSNDGSVDIIKKYEQHIDYWVSEADSGQSNAINKGFKRASGELYNWLNSDDILYPNALHIVADYYKRFPKYQMFFGNRIILDVHDRILKINEGPNFNRREARYFLKIPQETTFFTSTIWENVNGLDESLHYTMDADLWHKFMKYTDFKQIPYFLGAYREHDESKSVQVFGEVSQRDDSQDEFDEYARRYRTWVSKIPRIRRFLYLLSQSRLIIRKSSKKYRIELEHIYNLIAQLDADK
ncbi:glycosyltransferase family 2 protein [Carboxylicivirga sp. M1479]|uniref:glycosyltransferase family 2 protein n=1 Tax=Carboxylicivirga sp. M1479 TaxID=2594476 RepID=UPI00117843B9|nr:glycosyltransferase family 2 protein [Carboxylicivirga sp. M1479]TRX66355.1 glycosyltransferase [Carboxylicivirga sp. M1479]